MELDGWECSSEEEGESPTKPELTPDEYRERAARIQAEKDAKRKQHFRRARQRAAENRKKKGKKRDFRWKGVALEDIEFAKPTVVLDLGYCEMQRDKEVISVANQVQHCYGLNRKSERPLELHVVGLQLRSVEQVFARHDGFAHWKFFKHYCALEEAFPDNTSLVVLSPESPNVLDTVDTDATYVIGGISDNQNEFKGATLRAAAQAGVAHARLPLVEHCPDITTRGCVLNINHCYQILLLRSQRLSWAQAIDQAVPKREAFRKRE